jgi:hypothetical protein
MDADGEGHPAATRVFRMPGADPYRDSETRDCDVFAIPEGSKLK